VRAAPLRGLTAVLTTACNLECTYCFQTARGGVAMPWSVLRAALELLLEQGMSGAELVLTGGEPLLALPLVRRTVTWVEEHCSDEDRPGLVLMTNGLLLDVDTARFLARHRVATRLSFDGLAQDQRAPGTFGRLDRTVRLVRQQAPGLFHDHLSVTYTLTAANLPYLADSVQYLLELGVPEVVVFPLSTHDPGWVPATVHELEEQLVRVFELCLAHLERTGAVPLTAFRHGAEPPAGDTLCAVGRCDQVLVDVDGSLHGCTMLAGSYQRQPVSWQGQLQALRLGRVGDHDLDERRVRAEIAAHEIGLFHHRERKHTSIGRCADCEWPAQCTVCPMATVHIPANREPHRLPDNQCAFNRAILPLAERFPRRPGAHDVLTGNAPVPGAMADLMAAFDRRGRPRAREQRRVCVGPSEL